MNMSQTSKPVPDHVPPHLVRREPVIAVEEFLSAIPQFQIKPGAEIVTGVGFIIQNQTLPPVW